MATEKYLFEVTKLSGVKAYYGKDMQEIFMRYNQLKAEDADKAFDTIDECRRIQEDTVQAVKNLGIYISKVEPIKVTVF